MIGGFVARREQLRAWAQHDAEVYRAFTDTKHNTSNNKTLNKTRYLRPIRHSKIALN